MREWCPGDGCPLKRDCYRYLPYSVWHGDEQVPEGTLALPDDLITETAVSNPPSMCGVLLATGERARQMLWLSGQSGLDAGI